MFSSVFSVFFVTLPLSFAGYLECCLTERIIVFVKTWVCGQLAIDILKGVFVSCMRVNFFGQKK